MTENPIRFLRLQGLVRDWSKHTFQEYFQHSRFSSFECKIMGEGGGILLEGFLHKIILKWIGLENETGFSLIVFQG